MIKQMTLLLDLIFYFVLPILCWELGRGYLSDYLTIVISSLPGILYSFYRFLQMNNANFTRVFLFLNILIGLFIDLCSGSALNLVWNDAFYSLGLCVVYFISSFFKKPLFFYFALDLLVLQGYDRKLTKEILLNQDALKTIRIINLIHCLKELIYTIFLVYLLPIYGIEIFTSSILLDQLISFMVSGVSLIGYLYLYRFINGIVIVNKKTVRKKIVRLSPNMYLFFLECSYFFLRKHFL